MIEVFVLHNTRQYNMEYEWKGWRPDVYVKFHEHYFNVVVYDLTRLCQTFESEVNSDGYFSVDPGMIIVNAVQIDEIKKCIDGLAKGRFFNGLMPLSQEAILQLELIKV